MNNLPTRIITEQLRGYYYQMSLQHSFNYKPNRISFGGLIALGKLNCSHFSLGEALGCYVATLS